ncbi:uncharacterized protein LTR77_001905 [Saxophila tyrrhenica]|uniref:Uncharacterized protein n=1 Tax=Saxophila tyrrhenica TaxID=1690608 RepID=A0AAV9PR62_9PEZI|nr:hypothetical protein LTR77_001905 [Saxophila tyrrhenica]
MRTFLQTLLLAALLSLVANVLAIPVPMSDDEIQRRWSRGESEVCCSPHGPGCYMLAWFRSLAAVRREQDAGQSIHAAQSYRDATPAWAVLDRSSEDSKFTYATDERTMASHMGYQKREAPMTPQLLAKMKAFVKTFYRNRGEKAPVARSERDGMAPVLKPRGGWKYAFRA